MIEHPEWLLVGLIPLALLGLRREPRTVPVAAVSSFEGTPSSWRVRLRLIPELCRHVALASIALALAGPSCTTVSSARGGLDTLFLLDVSLSMRGMDLQPDRLRRAQAILEETAALRPDDRLGLLLFAGTHTLACPLTRDHNAFLSRLRGVSPSDGDGTAVRAAARAALDLLERAKAVLGVVVIVTDGVSTRDDLDLMETAARAFAAGVPIVVLKTGKEGPVPMPTEFGTVVVDMPDEGGALRALAERTGGLVIDAGRHDAARALATALATLDRPNLNTARRSTQRSGLFAGVALGALCLQLLATRGLRLC